MEPGTQSVGDGDSDVLGGAGCPPVRVSPG